MSVNIIVLISRSDSVNILISYQIDTIHSSAKKKIKFYFKLHPMYVCQQKINRMLISQLPTLLMGEMSFF